MKKSNKINNIIFSFLAIFIWIALFEGLSFLWLKNFGNPFLQTKRILKSHAYLGWIAKSGLDLEFYDTQVFTDQDGIRTHDGEPHSKYPNLVTLGPSSAFGWGVEYSQTYSSLVAQKLFNKEIGDSLLNLSQIGHSSFQGARLYSQVYEDISEAQIFLIAYGVNDLDRFRFFYASPLKDSTEFSKTKSRPGLDILNQSNFLVITSFYLNRWLSRFYCGWMTELPQQRVPLEETVQIQTELIRQIQKNGGRVVLVGTPHSYHGYNSNDILDIENDIKAKKIKNKEQLTAMLKLAETFPHQTMAFYKVMNYYAKRGKCRKAHDFFRKGQLNEPYRVVARINELNQRLKQLSRDLKIPFIDANHLLLQNKSLFVDPVHPNTLGHKKIADLILERLKLEDLNE